MRITPAVISAACVLGCMHVGRDIDFGRVRELAPGVSTRVDAERLFGPPAAVTVPSDGQVYCAWHYIHAGYAGIGTGSKNLTLRFRPDGVFVGVASESASGVDAASAEPWRQDPTRTQQ